MADTALTPVAGDGATQAARRRGQHGPTGKRVAGNLRTLRESRGLTVRALSDRLSQAGHPIFASGLTRIEGGKQAVDVDDLAALAEALETDVVELLAADDRTDSLVETTTTAVVARLTAARRRRGWSAEVMAQKCAAVGCPTFNRSVIANVESGRRGYITLDELAVLAEVMEVPMTELLSGGEAYVRAELAAVERSLRADALVSLQRDVANLRAGMGKDSVTPQLLARVAEIYRANIASKPTQAVARAFNVRARAASGYVQRARAAGLLPPTSQGKKQA